MLSSLLDNIFGRRSFYDIVGPITAIGNYFGNNRVVFHKTLDSDTISILRGGTILHAKEAKHAKQRNVQKSFWAIWGFD